MRHAGEQATTSVATTPLPPPVDETDAAWVPGEPPASAAPEVPPHGAGHERHEGEEEHGQTGASGVAQGASQEP